MPNLPDHLWCQILDRSTESLRSFLDIGDVALGHSEVNQLHMAIVVYDHIIWLQISVNDISLVEIFESQKNLSKVKSRLILTQRLLLGAHESL